MERITLEVEKRDRLGKGGARSLRRSGIIPAVLYRGGSATAVQLSEKNLSQFISKTAGEQVVAHLKFPDDLKQAIVKDYQVDPVKGHLLHVDFQEILATEEVRVMVHAVITGEAVGVKRDGGIMQYGIRDIEIECLPDKIPGHITVDISSLGVGQSVHVSDLQLGEGVRVLTDPDEVLVTITAVREEVPVVEAAPEVAEPEVIKKGKKAEEEE
ncbi:MAG: 50S ribosomal protein L25 [Chloroflexota bacterium]